MTIAGFDRKPTDPSTLIWAEDSTVTLKPGLYLWARARRTAQRLREALTQLGVRAVSALLRLDWRLDVAVPVEIWVAADHAVAARVTLERLLHAGTRIVVSVPDAGPTGWRDLGSAPVEQIHEIVAELDKAAEFGHPGKVRSVSAIVTASITVPARDAHLVGTYADTEPLASPQLLGPQISGTYRIQRTPVRRQRVR